MLVVPAAEQILQVVQSGIRFRVSRPDLFQPDVHERLVVIEDAGVLRQDLAEERGPRAPRGDDHQSPRVRRVPVTGIKLHFLCQLSLRLLDLPFEHVERFTRPPQKKS